MLGTSSLWPSALGTPAQPAKLSSQVHTQAWVLDPAADRTALADEWQALAQRAAGTLGSPPGSFFTSWLWINNWLAQLPAERRVCCLRAVREGHTIGLGVVVRGPHRRLYGLPFAPTWHLHASGDAALDSLCIEHNDFLVDPAHAQEARRALIEQWQQLSRGAQELRLPNLHDVPAGLPWTHALLRPGTALQAALHSKPSFAVDLAAVRAAGHDHLASRSANLRSQIRRSLRAYAELGELQLEAAPDTLTALAWLEQLATLHQAHWRAQGTPGAFAEPVFHRFHRQLIQQAGVHTPTQGHIQLLRLRAGAHDIAYLYNFVHAGRVYFYQSGLNYALAGKHARPGYVAHVLAIEFNARAGHALYDFMMGETRYKRDLATQESLMHSLVLRTPAWRFRAEDALRYARARWQANGN